MDQIFPTPPPADLAHAVWSRRLADEFWSGPVTPLTFTLLAAPMVDRMVERPLRVAGLDRLAGRAVFRLHASHVYVNAALLADVVDLLPGLVRSDGLLALLPAEARTHLGVAGALDGLPAAAVIAAKLLWWEPAWAPWRRAAAFERACAGVRAVQGAATVPSTAAPWTLTAELHRTQQALGDYLAVVNWGIVFAYVFYHLLGELVRRWAPELEAEAAALTVGLTGVASLDAHRDVLELGTLLAREATAVRERDLTGLAERAAADGGRLGTVFRHTLARHGHRLTGRDLTHPTWHEAPDLLVGLALRSARDGASASGGRPDATARRVAATAAIERRLGDGAGGLARRAAFRVALTAAQRYCLVRENMRYHADFFLARMRALVLALGRRLADDGTIGAPSDLFFLADDELRRLAARAVDLDGARAELDPRALAAQVAERRAAFEHDATYPPPLLLEASPVPATAPTSAGDPTTTIVAGEVGAPGSCTGRARIVRDSDDFDRVERGDVIVAAYADPAWTPMLDLASGLVLEAGGALSHGAIVARELGIPALVNARGALALVREGDLIELDTGSASLRIAARTAPHGER
jgi:pyruvate,water dikinase